jgi:hypothetical protein
VSEFDEGRGYDWAITTPYSEYPRTRSARFAAAVKAGWTIVGQNGHMEHDPRHPSDNRPWVDTDGTRYGSFDLTMVPSLEALQRGYVGMAHACVKHLAVTYAFAPCGRRLHSCYDGPPLISRGLLTGGTPRTNESTADYAMGDSDYGDLCPRCYESEVLGMARLTDAEKETVAYAAANIDELQRVINHFIPDGRGSVPMYRTQIPEHCFV